MIFLGTKQMSDPEALKKRLDYVNELLTESRPNASPSSQEWVSAEFWEHHTNSLRQERNEIKELLATLEGKR